MKLFPVLGALGMLGIYLTMATIPLAEKLGLIATESMFLRGASGVLAGVLIVAFLAFKKVRVVPSKELIFISVFFSLATFFLFKGAVAWGSNATVLFLDLAVLVPIVFSIRSGQRFGVSFYVMLLIAFFGTALALNVFETMTWNFDGFLFSLCAMLFNGLFIQYANRSTESNWVKAFWMSATLVLVSLILSNNPSEPLAIKQYDWTYISLLVGFSVLTGVLNFYSAFTAFTHLTSVQVGTFVLGVTPSVMLGSYFILGKTQNIEQIIGVVITIVSIYFIEKQRKQSLT
ncbi:MAG: hypothetical protein RI935_769 [Candidatus Parcubacteria bacterium]|jgi:drug/metabolite transporter (DMT)-like permease